jgi:Zn-dependent protease with chaperone function
VTVALALFGYALLLGTVGAHALARAEWVHRAPRLGIALWQALSGSVILAVALGGTALMIPTIELGQRLADLLQACGAAIRAQYATPGGAAVSAVGASVVAGTLGRAVYCLARELILASRHRRRHRDGLALIGRPAPKLGFLIVDHGTAAAYCLPGRRRQIVLTSAALAALDADQLDAVLAHERAHLRGRHHLVLAGAQGLQRAFPVLPCFRLAPLALARLVEMLADDEAVRRHPRLTIATALVALADSTAPAATLPAGGPTAAARVHRLAAPARPLGPVCTTLATLLLATAVIAPVALAVAPALAAVGANYCPIEFAPS